MKAAIGVILAVGMSVVACGGGADLCGASPCPNDVMATPAQMMTCRQTVDANKNASCFAQALALGQCQQQNIVCDSTGKTDGQISQTKATNNCKTQVDAAIMCCSTNKMSTACQ